MFWFRMVLIGLIAFIFKVIGLIRESYRIYRFNKGTYNWDNNWDNW